MNEPIQDSSGLFSTHRFAHAVSGCLGGSFAITVLFPFETVRTRLQVDDGQKCESSIRVIRRLATEEGFFSLYRGWRSLLVSLSVTNFIYFYVFHGLKLCLNEEDQSSYMDLLFGIIAGFAAVLISNPLWVVNVRLKIQGAHLKSKGHRETSYSGILDGILQISRDEGVLALWSGVHSSLILATNPALNFMIYELLKRNTITQLSIVFNESVLYFSYGAISKLIATVLTYPIQLIQARIRAGMSVSSIYSGSIFTFRSVSSFYRGMESKLIQTVLTSALMQLTYEHVLVFSYRILLVPALTHQEL